MSGAEHIELAINELAHDAYATSRDNGFHDDEDDISVPMHLVRVALAHSELSEFVEELRSPECDQDHLAEELADVIIRVADLAFTMELDLGAAVVAKMDKNKGRPYKHGKVI